MEMPEWLERAPPGTLGAFLARSTSRRKSGLFARHLCRCFPEAFADPRSLAAVDAADRYEEGEIDEPAYRAAVLAAAEAQHAATAPAAAEAQHAATADRWNNRRAWQAAYLAHQVAAHGYHREVLPHVGRIAGTSNSRHSKERKRGPRAMRQVFFEHFGDVRRPVAVERAWRSGPVVSLATVIYVDRAFELVPILADALQDAGCDNADVLAHCRAAGPHVRGCWVIDLLLGKS